MNKHHVAPDVEAIVRSVLADVLALPADRVAAFDDATPLFGALPELDSMAVAGILTEIEDRLGILIEDDEVDGEMLETFGALRRFAEAKAGAKIAK
jgi:acyl carrier protein